MKALPSIDDLTAVWRLLVVRAGIVLALGVIALPWPVMSVVGVLIILATVAFVGALFDAAITGALHDRVASGWLLLPEAVLGILLGGAVLLYPLAPLGTVATVLSLWTTTPTETKAWSATRQWCETLAPLRTMQLWPRVAKGCTTAFS